MIKPVIAKDDIITTQGQNLEILLKKLSLHSPFQLRNKLIIDHLVTIGYYKRQGRHLFTGTLQFLN
jgi:hypothetical protein